MFYGDFLKLPAMSVAGDLTFALGIVQCVWLRYDIVFKHIRIHNLKDGALLTSENQSRQTVSVDPSHSESETLCGSIEPNAFDLCSFRYHLLDSD